MRLSPNNGEFIKSWKTTTTISLCANFWHDRDFRFKKKENVTDPAETTVIIVPSNPHYEVIFIKLGSDHLAA